MNLGNKYFVKLFVILTVKILELRRKLILTKNFDQENCLFDVTFKNKRINILIFTPLFLGVNLWVFPQVDFGGVFSVL